MKKIGILDIGSNSIRLVLVKIRDNGSFTIFNDVKESVRLGMDMSENSMLNPDRIEKAIITIKHFKKICDVTGVDDIISVATAAVRNAKNKNILIERARDEIGLTIRVLSGDEEGYYAYLGVINSIDVTNALIMDIGGGSTELILIENKEIAQSASLPFGSITLTQLFKLTNNVSQPNKDKLSNFLIGMFNKISWLKSVKNIPLVGVGGTIRNISSIIQKRNKYPLEITHGFETAGSDVEKVYDLVSQLKLAQRKGVKGLSKSRADVFVGAVGAVATLIRYCGMERVVISGSGIREGIMYEYIHNNVKHINDILNFSLNNVMDKYDIDTGHAYHVFKLTKSLCNQLIEFKQYNLDVQKLIKTASLLHDSGINIDFYNHPQHSFYIILNSRISGLSHRELLLSGFIASLHRNKKSKINWLQYKKIINKMDVELIQKAGVLLRIAESLDICFTRAVEDVKCHIKNKEIVVETVSEINPGIEIAHAMLAAEQFKKVYRKKLVLI